MPNVDKHPQGRFCWIELHTTDRVAASEFYTNLFGWDAQHMPMGPDRVYTMFQFKGRAHGAASQMTNPGQPPNWQMFVAVDNVDESTATAIALGSTSPTGVGDVGDFGRMSIIRDPSGAILSLWQAKQHTGIGIQDEPGALCWAENYTNDSGQAIRFYTSLFGWKIKESPEYNEIHDAQGALGGILQIKPEWAGMPPCWMPYFQTTDCAAMVTRAELLGGKCMMAPKKMEGVGTIAMIVDPQGASFWLFQAL
jgi:predicted enzyme related to lactoylglutathione lyase